MENMNTSLIHNRERGTLRIDLAVALLPCVEVSLIEAPAPWTELDARESACDEAIEGVHVGEPEIRAGFLGCEQRPITRHELQTLCMLMNAVKADRTRLRASTLALRLFLGRTEEVTGSH